MKTSTCFESNHSAFIDLILTNKEFFKKSCTVEIGIFDHHVVASILKSELIKGAATDMEKFFKE